MNADTKRSPFEDLAGNRYLHTYADAPTARHAQCQPINPADSLRAFEKLQADFEQMKARVAKLEAEMLPFRRIG